MKKIIRLACLFLLIPSISHAAMLAVFSPMKDSTGANITNYAMTNGVAVNTQGILVEEQAGFSSILVSVDSSGDVDIYAEYSLDGSSWYRPYISDMAGTITVEGNIVTTLSNVTNRYIIYTPRPARYVRYVFDPDANSTVTAKFVYLKDR